MSYLRNKEIRRMNEKNKEKILSETNFNLLLEIYLKINFIIDMFFNFLEYLDSALAIVT